MGNRSRLGYSSHAHLLDPDLCRVQGGYLQTSWQGEIHQFCETMYLSMDIWINKCSAKYLYFVGGEVNEYSQSTKPCLMIILRNVKLDQKVFAEYILNE